MVMELQNQPELLTAGHHLLRPHSSCRSRLKSMLTARLMLLTPHQAVSHGAMMRGPFCIAQHLQQGRDHLEIDFQAVVGSGDKML